MELKEYDLLQPVLLLFIDFQSLLTLKLLSKRYTKTIDDESKAIGYWPALCNSYCYYAGLYSPIIYNPELILPMNYRKHFFDDLWPLRTKWSIDNVGPSNNQSYKIKVACRFRPGETPEGKVCLPLHQFLKLKRQQKVQKESQGIQNIPEVLIGSKEPEEFLDPFLGTLMKDPVLLTTSNRICDRSVALQCILRGGRDPFNNRKLTQANLQPVPDLLHQIIQWKEQHLKEKHDISVDIKETKGLVDQHGYNSELLDALLEIERINRSLKKAKNDIRHADNSSAMHQNDAILPPTPDEEEQPEQDNEEDLLLNEFLEGNGLLPHQQQQQQQNNENALMNFFGAPQTQQDSSRHSSSSSSKKAEVSRVVEVNNQQNFVSMHIPGSGVRPFHYSYVYNTNMKQIEIYENTIKESISSVLNGCNSSIMCYGQTGSGKTYTFLGPENCLENLSDLFISDGKPSSQSSEQLQHNLYKYPNVGLVIRTVQDLFLAKEALSKYQIQMTIGIQLIEVYEEKTTDLITGRPVSIRRENGHVNGPILHCSDAYEVLQYIQMAHQNQHYAETAMNQRSSRAHTFFIFHITQKLQRDPLRPGEGGEEGSTGNADGRKDDILLQSQLHLVDLAGSERVKKSQVTGLHFREAIGINSSLLVLGKVITSLVEERSHVPYYESKLTTILKSSFGGNSRTIVIINTRIEEIHGDETLQTLRFGERCSMISNSLKQIATSFDDTIHVLEDSLKKLWKSMKIFEEKGKIHLSSYTNLKSSYEILERKRNELILLQQEKNQKVSMKMSEVEEEGDGRPRQSLEFQRALENF